MVTLLALSVLLMLIGLVGGLASSSVPSVPRMLLLVGLVFAVPAGAGQSNPSVYPDGAASWIGPAALAAALLVPYLLGLGARHRLEHTASL
jgi:hypothetical protein